MNFEEIEKEGNTMNQGEFYKFCTDFNIPLTKVVNYFYSTKFQEIIDFYRKKALRQNQPLVFDNFRVFFFIVTLLGITHRYV